MKIKCKCLTCGKEFIGHECYQRIGKEKYCSKECYYNSRQPRPGRRTPDIKVNCLQCGKEFLTKDWRLKSGRGKFCSTSCRSKHTFTGRPNPAARENIKKATDAIRGKPAWNRNRFKIICKQCSNIFEVPLNRKDTAQFCSFVCASKNKTLRTGTNHPLWTRILKACEWCKREVYVIPAKSREFRFCSRQCQGAWTKSIGYRTSSIEKAIDEALTILQIPFESQYRIGRYSCDFALLQYKIVIECDGTYWHLLPKRKALDKVKDAFLKSEGWQVIRLKESDITTDLNKCLLRLTQYCKFI